MTNDSFFALACASIIALFFGFVMAFAGYRFFMFLLPIWGFFFGFGLGAQTIQAIFGTGFLSDVTSWVVGFIVALIFAVLSYLFYFIAVALLAGSLGYAIGAGVVLAIFPTFDIIAWIVGIVAAIALAAVVLFLNIQKWVVIIATALLGAGIILGTFLFLFGGLPPAELVANPVRTAISGNWLLIILFIVVAGLGAFAQFQASRRWKIEEYNRWVEINEGTAV
jgi:hypothetical protein